jgi:hypothetical protein
LTPDLIDQLIAAVSKNTIGKEMHMDFSENELGEKGAKVIAESLKSCKNVAFIDFNANRIHVGRISR